MQISNWSLNHTREESKIMFCFCFELCTISQFLNFCASKWQLPKQQMEWKRQENMQRIWVGLLYFIENNLKHADKLPAKSQKGEIYVNFKRHLYHFTYKVVVSSFF